MGLRQMYTAETMCIDDGLTDGAMFPPSSNAVYDALQNATELPSVTADDNGDVLTVVSGAWAKATPSGGGSLLMVEVEAIERGENNISYILLDKSYNEIKEAFLNGSVIRLHDTEDGIDGYCDFTISSIVDFVEDETPFFELILIGMLGESEFIFDGSDLDSPLAIGSPT